MPDTDPRHLDPAGELASEFEEMLAIEKERAKERQGERTDLGEHSANICKKSEEPARDKAAEKVNADVSGRTLEKGKTVKDKADARARADTANRTPRAVFPDRIRCVPLLDSTSSEAFGA